MKTQINYKGVDVEIQYRIDGDYYPATNETPEEQPEIEIIRVLVEGIDIMPILLDIQIEEIYKQIRL